MNCFHKLPQTTPICKEDIRQIQNAVLPWRQTKCCVAQILSYKGRPNAFADDAESFANTSKCVKIWVTCVTICVSLSSFRHLRTRIRQLSCDGHCELIWQWPHIEIICDNLSVTARSWEPRTYCCGPLELDSKVRKEEWKRRREEGRDAVREEDGEDEVSPT